MNQKTLQIIVGLILVAILGTTAVLIPYLINQRDKSGQALVPTDPDQSYAWQTDQSASSICKQTDGQATIEVRFSNTEPNQAKYKMNVVAKDLQTGKEVNMGTVDPGQTVTKVIETGRATISNGQVRFELTWTDGRSGVDSRTASYSALTCVQLTPTPTPTVQVSNTPTPTTQVSNTPTPTVKVSKTPTPTQSVSNTPTPTKTITNTPTPTDQPRSCRIVITPKRITPTATPTTQISNTPTPTGTITVTPTPGNLYCGSVGCQDNNDCGSGLSCVTADDGKKYCSKLNRLDQCADNPNAENCCGPFYSCGYTPCTDNDSCGGVNDNYSCVTATNGQKYCAENSRLDACINNPGQASCCGTTITNTPTPSTHITTTASRTPTPAEAKTPTPTPNIPQAGNSLPTFALVGGGLLVLFLAAALLL